MKPSDCLKLKWGLKTAPPGLTIPRDLLSQSLLVFDSAAPAAAAKGEKRNRLCLWSQMRWHKTFQAPQSN